MGNHLPGTDLNSGTRQPGSRRWTIAGLVLAAALHFSVYGAATNPVVPTPGPRPGLRTNPPPVKTPPKIAVPPAGAPRPAAAGAITNALAGKAGTNVAASAKQTNDPSGLAITAQKLGASIKSLPSHPFFYPVVGVLVVGLAGLLVYRQVKGKSRRPASPAVGAVSKLAKPAARKASHSCNVLELTPEASRVWQFDARGAGFALRTQETTLPGERLPSGMVAKDWRDLFQPRLNIAWLPYETVFLRVIQLPKSDFEETLSMVEFQLEKLSPIPLAQIVWSLHVLSHAQGDQQTVIVTIVARSFVEEYLGKLEGQGYLADRLDLPMVDQLQATPITDDGAYIYPEPGSGSKKALVAWWYGGILQSLDLLSLPVADRAKGIREQVLQMAWAGEMGGWLNTPPKWHLVADNDTAAVWEPALREGLDQAIEREQPLSSGDLAGLSAKRGAHADSRANLLPVEFSERYKNQFFDRLWMRGVGAVIAVYLVGVGIYLVALQVLRFQTSRVENQVAVVSVNYTNAIRASRTS